MTGQDKPVRVETPDIEAARAALVVARITMEAKGWWLNEAGYLTDAALWIDRADAMLAPALPHAGEPE